MPSDARELLDRGAPTPLRDLDVDALEARGRQWHRRRTATAAAAIAVVAALAAVPLPRLLSPPADVILDQPPTTPLLGTWVSIDSDGSSQTMDISADRGRYQADVDDDGATVCAGGSSSMTGTGQLDGGELVIAAPVLTCDDGSTPLSPDGSSLEEALRNYTLTHDVATNTVTDSLGIRWQRPSAAPVPGSTEAPPPTPMWPQSNLREIRDAQEGADAGDPAAAWQVEPAMEDVGGDAEIFTRFLTEELGWDDAHWGATSHSSGWMDWNVNDGSASVDFVRCTVRVPNPIYPDDPAGGRCAPTGDDYAYETVRVTAYQPLGADPEGIWVISSSEPQESFRQLDPLTDAEIERGVEPFLDARIDGQGARNWAGHVPLLYASTEGARYQRYDYEVVDGPTWPFGAVKVNVRLFADEGGGVVEQRFTLELDTSTEVTPAPPHRLTSLLYDRYERPTTEDGNPVPEAYELFGRHVAFEAEWTWSDEVSGPHGPDTAALYRGAQHDRVFAVVGNPFTPTETCDAGEEPQSVDDLVRNLQAAGNLSVTEPRSVRVGQFDAVQLDVTPRGAGIGCVVSPDAPEQPFEGPAVLAPLADHNHPELRLWWGLGPEVKARLYAFELPGKKPRTIAILVMAPADDFDAVVQALQPTLDSFEAR